MEGKRVDDKRFCYGCGSNHTYVNTRGSEEWSTNFPTPFYLCKSCYRKYVEYPIKRDFEDINRRLIRFRNRQIKLDKNPRTGICSQCKRKDGDSYINKRGKSCKIKTTIHHLEYHEDDPLKDTIELCRQCHPEEDWRLGKYTARPNNNQPRDSISGRFISRVA